MKLLHSLAAAAAAATAAISPAADLELLSAVGFKPVVADAVPQFEKATGHHVSVRYGTLGDVVKRVQAGESADVVLIPKHGLEELAAAGRIAAADIAPIATSQLGMAVRASAPKPDISTTDNFRNAMLEAKSVTMVNPAAGGASYALFRTAFERMKIMEQMQPKIVHMRTPGREGIEREVRDGNVDVALNQMQELRGIPGLDVVGPLPRELQQGTTFAAAPMKGTAKAGAAHEFVESMRAPARAGLIRSKGLEPAT